MAEASRNDVLPSSEDKTPYRKLTSAHAGTATFNGQKVLTVEAPTVEAPSPRTPKPADSAAAEDAGEKVVTLDSFREVALTG